MVHGSLSFTCQTLLSKSTISRGICIAAMVIFLIMSFPLGFFLIYFLLPLIDQSSFIRKASSSYGPPSHPFIGCLISFYKNRHRLLDWYTDLLSESPSQTVLVHRLGARRTIVTANPANVEHILKTNFSNFPKGKPFTEILGDLLGWGIFNVDGELWSAQRKLASHEFSTKSLREFTVKTLQEEVENRLIPLLEDAMNSEKVLDLQDVLKRFAFDIVSKVSLGFDPFCLDLSKPVPPLVRAFDTASEICAMRGNAPLYLIWKLKRVFNIGSEMKLKEAIKLVHDSVLDIIQNKKNALKNDPERKCDEDLLSRMLSAGQSEEVIRDMVISFIMAGRDTTSAAMTWLFWLLSENKTIEKMIVDEVESVLNRGERPLDYESLKKMNILKACLCESMRLYPPVAWDSKHAAVDNVFPDGTRIREGDRVTYIPYGMGRMEELWGKDCLEFKPDRWFEEAGSENIVLKSVSPYQFPVFQAGPRVCLGKEMAFIQMKYVVGSVLRRFEMKAVCEKRPVFVPLLTAHMAGGLKVLVRRRTITNVVSP